MDVETSLGGLLFIFLNVERVGAVARGEKDCRAPVGMVRNEAGFVNVYLRFDKEGNPRTTVDGRSWVFDAGVEGLAFINLEEINAMLRGERDKTYGVGSLSKGLGADIYSLWLTVEKATGKPFFSRRGYLKLTARKHVPKAQPPQFRMSGKVSR